MYTHRHLRIIPLLLSFAALPQAWAESTVDTTQPPPHEIPLKTNNVKPENCAVIADNAARLNCYDTLFQAAHTAASTDADKTSAPVETTNLAKTETTTGTPETVEPEISPLSRMYDLDENDEAGILSVREHNHMYLMPIWYNTNPNYTPESPTRGIADDSVSKEQKHAEAKLQLSFKTKIAQDILKTRADLWFGYTQKSNWQVWNQGHKSAPFRNTDYMPEIFLTQPMNIPLPFNGKLRMVGIGMMHQSNGKNGELSRSWNRAYAMAGMEWGKLTVVPRIWTRIFNEGGIKDDNPDITRYMGHGDLKLQYRFNDRQMMESTLRLNTQTGKGAIDFGYAFPLKGKLKAYARVFHGYGENLLDYNHKQTGVGIGLMMEEWDGF